jgi:hypothetical protein
MICSSRLKFGSVRVDQGKIEDEAFTPWKSGNAKAAIQVDTSTTDYETPLLASQIQIILQAVGRY